MGMSDRQFDSYQSKILRILKKAEEEIREKGESKELIGLINDIEAELKRP